jgi:hypothetical protein
MPLQLTVTSPAMREYAQQGLRQQLNAGRRADRADHEVTDAAPADEMAVNAEGASRDLRASPALENSRIWPDGRTVGERAPRRRIVAA